MFIYIGYWTLNIYYYYYRQQQEISKGGKIMIKENTMIILNSLEKCRGKWTRSSGREKSIIYYIVIGEEDENGVESIIMDEKKVPISIEEKFFMITM